MLDCHCKESSLTTLQDSWNQLSITIDNPKKLMEIGISRDLGVCKGVRKSDNKPCCMFINK